MFWLHPILTIVSCIIVTILWTKRPSLVQPVDVKIWIAKIDFVVELDACDENKDFIFNAGDRDINFRDDAEAAYIMILH